MPPIRTLLWIGRGRRFAGSLVADAPTLDIVWEADLESALTLALEALDAIVFDAEDLEAASIGLERLLRERAAVPVVLRIDAGDAASIPALRERGAAEVLLRSDPLEGEPTSAELVACIERITGEHDRRIHRRAGARDCSSPSPAIVGDSPAMRVVYALVERAARSEATVLVTGETGTGKELIARAVHDARRRRSGEFVALNCAAFPETLLESELFGHAKGAFTGANRDHDGLFVAAHGGTIFLDEVSETSATFQAKLLRALQEREVRALGSSRSRPVDVRVIAASNRDLWTEVQTGRFREDLFFRLAVFPIHVPPLRERTSDLLALAEHFAGLYGGREGARGVILSQRARRLLTSYAWPGNVRELENEMQRALAMLEPGQPLLPTHFSDRVRERGTAVETAAREGETLRASLLRIEAALLRNALDAHDGRRGATAQTLGITREGLYKKMKRMGIE